MNDELAGKVAIVTGGASGLGRATVQRFVAAGARVLIADLDRQQGEELAAGSGGGARFQCTDVADAEQMTDLITTAVTAFGDLHIMVNNAGIGGSMHEDFLDDDLADFNRVMAVNLLGVMLGTREAARYMSGAGGGSIVNVSSIGGVRAGKRVMTYRASKAAVVHFSKCAAIDLGTHGIRVNCIAPGNIPTSIMESTVQQRDAGDRETFVTTMRQKMRVGRPLDCDGEPEDVAEAALYFASDRSRFVTGTVLPVDGGTVAGALVRAR